MVVVTKLADDSFTPFSPAYAPQQEGGSGSLSTTAATAITAPVGDKRPPAARASQPRANGSPPTRPPAAAPTSQQTCRLANSCPSSPAAGPSHKQRPLLAIGHYHLLVGAPTRQPPPSPTSRRRRPPEAAPAHAPPGAPSRQWPHAPASNHPHPPSADVSAGQRPCWQTSRRPPASGGPSEPSVAFGPPSGAPAR